MKLWIALGYMGLLLVFLSAQAPSAQPPLGRNPVFGLFLMMGSFVTVMSTWFAGAGIVSQGSFQFLKGLHGSTQYTLSLPVSRLRLLAVRATLGWMEMACVIGVCCCGVWLLAPLLTSRATAVEMLQYALTLIACTSALYFLSVLLATFLDDQWRAWGTMLGCVAIWGLPYLTRVPPYADIFRAMGESSPLLVHRMPWTAMAFSLGLAAILFFAALKIVQRREY